MDKAQSSSLSFLHLCALCAPFILILLMFLHLPCCLNSFVVSLAVCPQSFCPSLFILSVSLKFSFSYLCLIPTAPGSSLCWICTSGSDSCSPCDVSERVGEREREMAGDLKRDSTHFSFFRVPVESMILDHVDVRWLQDQYAILTQSAVLIFMECDSAGLVQGDGEEERAGGKERVFLINKSCSSLAQSVHCSTVAPHAARQMALLHSTMSLHLTCSSMIVLTVCKFNV